MVTGRVTGQVTQVISRLTHCGLRKLALALALQVQGWLWLVVL